MRRDVQRYLEAHPDLKHFVRMNPHWYRYLSRNPLQYRQLEQAADQFYGRTFPQRMENFQQKMQTASFAMELFKMLSTPHDTSKE